MILKKASNTLTSIFCSLYSINLLWKWKWKSLSPVWLFVTPWTVNGILQARKLEWVVFPFSRGFSQPREGDINQWQRVFDGYTSQLPHLSAGIVLRYGLHVPRVPGQNTLQLLKVMTSLITCPLPASFLSHPASSFHHQCFLGSSPKNITSTSETFPLEKK